MDSLTTATPLKIEVEIPDELLDRLAEEVAARVEGLLVEGRSASEYLTVEEAATYLRCSRTRIYRLVAADELPHYKLGARTLFSPREIDTWLAMSRNDPGSRAPRLSEAAAPRTSTVTRGNSLEASPSVSQQSSRVAKPKGKNKRRIPLQLSADEEHRSMWASALGMSREDFDRLTPREFDKLWNERATRISALSQEKKEALFDWDPQVERLSKMTIVQIEELAEQLVEVSPVEDASG